jgi:hypothetical protein
MNKKRNMPINAGFLKKLLTSFIKIHNVNLLILYMEAI